MADMITQEIEDTPAEEMSAEQEADFEKVFDSDTQAADAMKKTEKADRMDNTDISETDIEDASSEENKNASSDNMGVKVFLDGQEYVFSKEEIENQKNTPNEEQRILERLAEQAGISKEELISRAEQAEDEAKCAMRAQQLSGQGYDYEMAEHIARIELENARYKNNPGNDPQMKEKAIVFSGIDEFERMYPDVEDLPDTVVEEIRAGASPVAAYQNYLLEEREQELRALKHEKKNREKLPGSVKGLGVEAEDPFITELMK